MNFSSYRHEMSRLVTGGGGEWEEVGAKVAALEGAVLIVLVVEVEEADAVGLRVLTEAGEVIEPEEGWPRRLPSRRAASALARLLESPSASAPPG